MNVKEIENMDNNISAVNTNFYEKYHPQIRAIVTRILNNADLSCDIDDCVNTVYIELIERLIQYNETRGTMGAFVSIIARSTALNYCRSNMRRRGELIGDDKIAFFYNPLEFENEVEFEMLIESIFKKLNKQEKALFNMKFMFFYSPEEIAKVLNIRQNTVNKRVGRLKNKIKNFLIRGGITVYE
ncbi:MAG: sigma-70 family RNA polymerase sigma factor [Oscillospiraceae bacterium]|nr:sigma-70 family RNA polymerase sigma factor [Oscillospiraceae bacterium]